MRTMSLYREGNTIFAVITWMIKLQVYLTVLLLVVAPGLLSLSYKDFDALGKN